MRLGFVINTEMYNDRSLSVPEPVAQIDAVQDYEKFTVYELGKILFARNLLSTKNKEIAVIRLQNYDEKQGNVYRVAKPSPFVPKIQLTPTIASTLYNDESKPFHGLPVYIIQSLILKHLQNACLWQLAQTCRLMYSIGSKILCERFRLFLLHQTTVTVSPLEVSDDDMRTILKAGNGITPSAALYGFSINCCFRRGQARGVPSAKKLNELVKLISHAGSFEGGMQLRAEKRAELQIRNQAREKKQEIERQLWEQKLYERKERTRKLNYEIRKAGYDWIYPYVVQCHLVDGYDCGRIYHFHEVLNTFIKHPDDVRVVELRKSVSALDGYINDGTSFPVDYFWYHLVVFATQFRLCTLSLFEQGLQSIIGPSRVPSYLLPSKLIVPRTADFKIVAPYLLPLVAPNKFIPAVASVVPLPVSTEPIKAVNRRENVEAILKARRVAGKSIKEPVAQMAPKRLMEHSDDNERVQKQITICLICEDEQKCESCQDSG